MAYSRFRKSIGPEEDDSKVDMSPMIDMVFLLLIFFIVNATAIIVRQDPDVTPPSASNGAMPGTGEGKIVVNVHEDGTFTSEDLKVLPDEDAIRHYIQEARDALDLRAVTPKLHLRGDKASLFKHGRVAVRAASQAEVDQIIFAARLWDR